MQDPNAFLSTISQSSAAMVAIIGGFLVSKLIAISSEREGIKRQLKAARDKQRHASNDYDPVHQERLAYSQSVFADAKLEEIIENHDKVINYTLLAEDYQPRGSTISEMTEYAEKLHERVRDAYKNISAKVKADDSKDISLNDLKKRGLKFTSEDEFIYDAVLDDIASKFKEPYSSYMMPPPSVRMSAIIPDSTRTIQARRQDETIHEENRLHTEMLARGYEIERLSQDLENIGRPVGVVPGIWILVFLSLVGIVAPVIIMAISPKTLEPWEYITLTTGFIIGLSAVLGYIYWYLRKIRKD